MQGGESRLQWNIEAFPHFETDYLKNTFVQYLKKKKEIRAPKTHLSSHMHMYNEANRIMRFSYQLHDEGPDEAHHAGPGVPHLRGLGEPQERLTQLGLHPWHLDLAERNTKVSATKVK